MDKWSDDWILSVVNLLSYMETGPAFLGKFREDPLYKHAGDDYGLFGITKIFAEEHAGALEWAAEHLDEDERATIVEYATATGTPVITVAMVLRAYAKWCAADKREMRESLVRFADCMRFYRYYRLGPSGAKKSTPKLDAQMASRLKTYAATARDWLNESIAIA